MKSFHLQYIIYFMLLKVPFPSHITRDNRLGHAKMTRGVNDTYTPLTPPSILDGHKESPS